MAPSPTTAIEGVGGPATEVSIGFAAGRRTLARFSDGDVLFSDGAALFRVDGSSGLLSLVAGTGTPGSSGDGGPAVDATIDPDRVVVGPDDSVWFAQDFGTVQVGDDVRAGFRTLRRVTPDGTIGAVDTSLADVPPAFEDFAVRADGTVVLLGNAWDAASESPRLVVHRIAAATGAITWSTTPTECRVGGTYTLEPPTVSGDLVQWVGTSSTAGVARCTVDLATDVVTATSLGLDGWDVRSNVALRSDGSIAWTGYDPQGAFDGNGGLWSNGTVAPPPPPLPTVSIDDVSAREDSGLVDQQLRFTFSSPLPAEACFSYRVIDGTATRPADYTPNPGRVCLPAGTQTATTGVPFVDDVLVEADETFEVELFDLVGALPGRIRSTWTILDDEARDLRTVSLEDVVALEDSGATARRLTFRLDQPLVSNVCFRFRFIDGTARRPADYRPNPGRVCFGAGALAPSTTVPFVDDTSVEPDETFEVELYDLQGVLPGRTRATWTILDDETREQPTVSIADVAALEDAPLSSRQVRFTFSAPLPGRACLRIRYVDETALKGVDHRGKDGRTCFPAGATTATLGVPFVDDALVEPDETFRVELSDLQGVRPGQVVARWTILDDDARGV